MRFNPIKPYTRPSLFFYVSHCRLINFTIFFCRTFNSVFRLIKSVRPNFNVSLENTKLLKLFLFYVDFYWLNYCCWIFLLERGSIFAIESFALIKISLLVFFRFKKSSCQFLYSGNVQPDQILYGARHLPWPRRIERVVIQFYCNP